MVITTIFKASVKIKRESLKIAFQKNAPRSKETKGLGLKENLIFILINKIYKRDAPYYRHKHGQHGANAVRPANPKKNKNNKYF